MRLKVQWRYGGLVVEVLETDVFSTCFVRLLYFDCLIVYLFVCLNLLMCTLFPFLFSPA